MSQENVEIVLSAYRAMERGDYQLALDLADEDIVWDMSDLGVPDLARVYLGLDGVRQFWTAWLAAWEAIEFRRLTPEDRGDRVIVDVEQRNMGRGSGVAVDFHYFQAFTVRQRKITASHGAQTRSAALEAVGLSD